MVFGLGMAQIAVVGGDPDGNLARAAAAVHAAAAQGLRAVVLPECLDLGWTHPSARSLAEPIPGPRSELLAQAARRAGIWVCAGLTERAGERVHNAAVLLDPRGRIVLHHRKIHELSIASDLYAAGDRLAVADTPLGRVGLAICADNLPGAAVLGHALARMGAQVVLSPCAWAVPADFGQETEPYGAVWLRAYGELARLYDLTLIGVSNVGPLTAGPWRGRCCIGSSLAVGPGGAVLARGPYGVDAEALIPLRVEPAPPIAWGDGFVPALRARGHEAP